MIDNEWVGVISWPLLSGGSTLEQGYNCIPSYWLCTPSLARSNKKLSLWIILLCCVDRNAWESEICLRCNWWCV